MTKIIHGKRPPPFAGFCTIAKRNAVKRCIIHNAHTFQILGNRVILFKEPNAGDIIRAVKEDRCDLSVTEFGYDPVKVLGSDLGVKYIRCTM